MVRTVSTLILCAALLAWLLPAQFCGAAEYYWGGHPDKDRLVFVLPDGTPSYNVKRIDKTRLFVELPDEVTPRGGRQLDFQGSKRIASIQPAQGGLVVNLRTPAFGYIHFPLPEQNKVVLDLFSDPIGAKWRPRKGGSSKPVVLKKTPTQPKKATPRKTVRGASPTRAKAKSKSRQPVPSSDFALEEPAQMETEQPRRPFFAVPYTYRGRINSGGMEDWNAELGTEPYADPQGMEGVTPGISDTQEAGVRGKVAPRPDSYLGEIVEEEELPVTEEMETPAPAPSPVRRPVRFPSSSEAPENAVEESPLAGLTPMDDSGQKAVPFIASNEFRAPVAPPGERASYQAVAPEALAMSPAVPMKPASPEPTQMESEVVAPSSSMKAGSTPAGARVQYSPPTNDFRARIAAPGDKVVYRMEEPRYTVTPQAETSGDMQQTASIPGVGAGSDGAQTFFPTNDFRAPIAPPGDQVVYRAVSPEEMAATDSSQAEGDDAWPGADEAAPEADSDSEGLFGEEEKVAMEEGAQGEKGEEEVGNDELLMEAKLHMNNGDYENARKSFEMLKRKSNLTEAMREEVLYTLADLYYSLGREDRLTNYDLTTNAYNVAMNYNVKSNRVPAALLKLGMINLKVGNLREAEAYFNILRTEYPMDDNLPLIQYYWGEYYYQKEEYQKAADHFQTVVQEYPDTKFVREASVGLAEALVKLGYDDQAFEIVDYIDKRWPRFYAEYPPILRLMGDVTFKTKDYEKSKGYYWTYYNLDPEEEDIHMVLARLGDIYLQDGQEKAAREVYQEAANRFPNKDGGLVSQMRLAEEGVYNEPTVETMYSVFNRPFDLKPSEIYADIVENHPDSELAPLAQVKLAMWHLWNKNYRQALEETAKFKEKFPDSDLIKAAREVAAQTFERMVADLTQEEHYARIVEIWKKFPMIQESLEEMGPESRISVALSFSKRGLPDIAEELLHPFFRGGMVADYSEMALHLALSIYLDNQAWARIPMLADKVELWDLTPESKRELDYSLALAFENLGAEDKAKPLWIKLSKDEGLDPAKRAYPIYFLAQEAMDQRDLTLANTYALEALGMFLEAKSTDTEKLRNLLGILMDVTESSGRLDRALKWAQEYAKYVPRDDPGWAALRYRTAQLFRQAANTEEWESILKELTTDMPESFYGRMAASELKTYKLEQSARQFAPTGSL
jgi:TolA-binding protein